MRDLHFLAALVLFAANGWIAAAGPECSRVLPGPLFPRPEIVDEDTVRIHAIVGTSGESGLVFVRAQPFPAPPGRSRYYLQSAVPDGSGTLALGEEKDLVEPDRFSFPRKLFAGDADGDGTPDLILYWAANARGRTTLDFFKGLGAGEYASPVRQVLGTTRHVADPELGDFDGDGRIEVVAFVPLSMRVLGIENGGWRFENVQAAGTFTDAEVVDWNDDGLDDVAFLISDTSLAVLFGAPSLPLNGAEIVPTGYSTIGLSSLNGKLLAIEGTRIFFFWTTEAIHQLERGSPDAWTIRLGDNSGAPYPPIDLDGDGLEDLTFGDKAHFFWGGIAGFKIFWGQAAGAPIAGPESAARTHVVAGVDVNDDGVRDLVTSDYAVLPQPAPRQLEEGLFSTMASQDIVDEPYLSVRVGDLDEDGLDDLVLEALYPHVLSAALSRGDGRFDIAPLAANAEDFSDSVLIDLDRDGHLDLGAESGPRNVAWGLGDGSFDPYDLVPTSARVVTRRFGELNGDGVPDVVEVSCDSYTCDPAVLGTAFGAARTWHETPFTLVLGADDYRIRWTLADLDADGLDDLVITHRIDGGPFAVRVAWRRALGDGSFGDESDVIDVDFPDGLERITPTDFDLDGVTDLFLQPWTWTQTAYHSVRSDGRGGFAVVWTGSRTRPKSGIDDALHDVDGDGRPDLISGQYSGWLDPQYYVQIRRGDGLGGFLPVEPTTWRGAPGPPGVFRHGGARDLVRLMQFTSFRLNLELFPSLGSVLPRDVAPPTVEVGVTPAGDSRWRITTVPLDECGDAPRIVRRVVEMLPARPHPEPSFERAESFEIRIYEVPSQKRRDVLLLGPSEDEARKRYAAALRQGGVPFEHFGVLQVGITNEPGDEQGPTIRGARLAQRFVFEGDVLVAAFASHPDADLMLAVDALDRAGRRDVP
jgi:hypothetical protein